MRKLLLTLALLGLPVISMGETLEYATFEDHGYLGGWFESDGLLCQSDNKQELLACLGGKNSVVGAIPRFAILNAIGNKGWELVSTMGTSSSNPILLFKREKTQQQEPVNPN